jgi:outer membrane lipoprotein-sorting protein
VNCDFCHVIKSPTDRDFASDDKEEKRTAREMMHLVIDTNAKFFHERPMVSCVTCHRGSTEPLSVPVLPVALPQPRPEPSAQAAAPAKPTRDEIVARYAKALGKIDEKALASMEMKGTRETSRGTGPIDVVIAPGRVRVTSTTPEGEMVNVVSGSEGWMRDPKGTQPMQPVQVETMNQTLDAYRITLPSEIPAEARVSKNKVGDKDAWVITIPFGTSGTQRLYFDAQTGLLVRRLRLTRVPIGQIPQQTDFDDYRDVGGMKLPFVVRVDTIDPRGGATRRYSEIKLNAKVDESLFVQP